VKFTIFQESRIGKRKANQDRIAHCYTRDALLMVLADGMGGHLHGEIAAHIAMQSITQSFQRKAQPTLLDPGLFLSQSLTSAHNAILDYAFDKDLRDIPRTTVVVCAVQTGYAHWAHAGDSRLYLLREGRIQSQTHDHSRVQLMMDQGLLDVHSAATHPSRNRIYSCLGGTQPPQIDFSRRTPLHNGDVLMLCSDGAWGPLGNENLVRGFNGTNPMDAVPRLLSQAETKAGANCDNLSMVAMLWLDETVNTISEVVSTQTMALHDFTTQMDSFERLHSSKDGGSMDLTEDEIERAIAEINAAIRKFSK
jgi:serine/threonine protein phosphatase PrpC